MQFVESEEQIALGMGNVVASENLCKAWDTWEATMPYAQDDSGI
jgi:hypothetical protein